MTRKTVLGLIAAASLGAAALLPTSASAHGFHGGWHHGFGFGGLYIDTGVSDCYQQRIVQTPRGPRVRMVNVCY